MSDTAKQILFSVVMLAAFVALLGAARTVYSLVVWFRFITGV